MQNGFRFYFTPLFGVLPTFPSRYWSTIGLPGVFSLSGWSPILQTGFHVSRPTQVADLSAVTYPYGSVTLCAVPFQTLLVRSASLMSAPMTPHSP